MQEPAIGLGAFTRYCALVGLFDGAAAQDRSEVYQASAPVVRRVLDMRAKGAVAAGTTTGTTWASPLASPDGKAMTAPFIRAVAQRSLIGRMQNVHRATFYERIVLMVTRPTAHWVSENS